MPYDANLVLRGQYEEAYVDLDAADVTPTSLVVNDDGNICVDLGNSGSGAKGLDVVVIFHDTPVDYTDVCNIVICESDHLDAGWAVTVTFPTVYCYMREVIATATVAFDASDDLNQVLTATTDLATGVIRHFSRKLTTIGGTGKIWVEMQDNGDTYGTTEDTLSSAVTGVATQVGVSRVIQTPLILVRRFSTPKRYIRCTNTVTNSSGNADFGDVDILVTDSQHSHVNNLYM